MSLLSVGQQLFKLIHNIPYFHTLSCTPIQFICQSIQSSYLLLQRLHHPAVRRVVLVKSSSLISSSSLMVLSLPTGVTLCSLLPFGYGLVGFTIHVINTGMMAFSASFADKRTPPPTFGIREGIEQPTVLDVAKPLHSAAPSWWALPLAFCSSNAANRLSQRVRLGE